MGVYFLWVDEGVGRGLLLVNGNDWTFFIGR